MSKDAFYSLIPLNVLLRTIALSNIYRKGIQLAESGSTIKTVAYIITFGLLNLFCFHYKMQNFRGNITTGVVKFSDSVQMIYWISYIEYLIDIFYVFKFGRSLLLNYFKNFDQIDNILGVSCYNEMRKTITVTIIFCTSISTIVCVFDYICWLTIHDWKIATICCIDYIWFIVNMFTILDVVSHVVQVEYRLKIISGLMQKCNSSNTIVSFHEDIKINTVTVRHKKEDPLKTLRNARCYESVWFVRCYLLLLNQIAYINASYGFRVLVYCVNLLINTINLHNLAIRIFTRSMFIGHGLTGILTLMSTVASTMRALNYILLTIILTYRCEQAYKQSDKLLETIDVLLTSENCGLKADFLEFRNLIITRPVKFHAAKFFTIDYTVLVSLTSVIVTYTIIMLQSFN